MDRTTALPGAKSPDLVNITNAERKKRSEKKEWAGFSPGEKIFLPLPALLWYFIVIPI